MSINDFYEGEKVQQLMEQHYLTEHRWQSMPAQMQYIIWNPDFTTSTAIRFDTRHKAQQEAERLAAQYPNHQFYVCALVSVSKTTSVQTEQLDGVSGDNVGVRL